MSGSADFEYKCPQCDHLFFTVSSTRAKNRIFGPQYLQCPQCDHSLKMPWKEWQDGTLAEKTKFTMRQLLGTFLVTVAVVFFIGLPMGEILDKIFKVDVSNDYAVYANYTIWVGLFLTTQINVRRNRIFVISKLLQW